MVMSTYELVMPQCDAFVSLQPFPLQTNSLFGGSPVGLSNPGAFGPVGIGAVPRHVNIHIHTGKDVVILLV